MASVVIISGLAIYFTVRHVEKKKNKKRALKAQLALERSYAEGNSFIDNASPRSSHEEPPAYNNERLPAYIPGTHSAAVEDIKRDLGLSNPAPRVMVH